MSGSGSGSGLKKPSGSGSGFSLSGNGVSGLKNVGSRNAWLIGTFSTLRRCVVFGRMLQ